MFNKNDKVTIISGDEIFLGKTGTVIEEGEEDITEKGKDLTLVKVRVDFPTPDNPDNEVIENFYRSELELEAKNESLNESDKPAAQSIEDCQKWVDYDMEHYGHISAETNNLVKKAGFQIVKDDHGDYEVAAMDYDSSNKQNESCNEEKHVCPKCGKEVCECNDNLNESLIKEEKKEEKFDCIYPYVYIEDIDGEEVPSWNFAAKIATAEDVEKEIILDCAKDHKYKIFVIQAPNFQKEIVAAKEITLEDIMNDYAEFLQGNAVVKEFKY